MKKTGGFTVILTLIALLSFTSFAYAEIHAICVPWQPSNPALPHYTYDGADITLKGIARGDAGETLVGYEWDFGDGSPPVLNSITDPYNLSINHSYTGSVGQLFIATLTIYDSEGMIAQDQYPVQIYESSDLSIPSHLDVRINMAIDEGLWWLHTNMIRATADPGPPGYEQAYGYWDPSYYPLAATAVAVDAFQLHGSKANMDYDSDPYVETVQRGLNFILGQTYSFPIGVQLAGDPDTNGNGIGLVANHSNYLYDGRQTYIGGICLVTLASSGAPNRIAQVGGLDVHGRPYADIVQDMVDFFAWGQVDTGSGRGGWRYHANYSGSDMSTTQWPPLGMLAAEDNMGSTVPQFVRDELIYFLDYTQHTDCDWNYGGFGYSYDINMPNITKAAAGIICHEFLGTPLDNPKVASAIGFIYRHWNDSGTSWDYTQLLGNSYGMYGVMKALRIPEPDIARVNEYECGGLTVNSFDWYYTPEFQANEGLATYTVNTQQADGSWDDTVGPNAVYDAFATGWRILVLLKGVTILPPEAVICDCDEQEYNLGQDIILDATCSYHPDITRSIVSYEWDLDNDGIFDDATEANAVIQDGFADTGYYPVSVRVTDDNPDYLGGPQTGIYTCQVYVHPPPHCPHAFAGGPYLGWIGTPVTFDASASWDPDNEIVLYEWDFDNDSVYDASSEEPTATHTWTSPYTGVVALRVTDAAGEYAQCSDTDFATVEIGNHAPVADPAGPYSASYDSIISLDGSGSYDPDPNDDISFAWDTDNDGNFDDSTDIAPEFYVGPDVGVVHDICLKVTDSFGLTNVACTTVTVVANQPPVADPNGPYLGPANMAIAFDGSGSSDPDGDTLSFEWDCGDGGTETGETPSHTYLAAGIYDVCLTVDDGFVASDTECTYVVVYDPSAGFVTGGGWIESPLGAYPADPTLTGKATFGFVSKYNKKITDLPSGETEFQFHVADLNFHSESYEWLLILGGGTTAKFKGDGMINGEYDANGNPFKFMLWAIDEAPVDTFRIRIWSEDDLGNENVVYDNGFDQPISSGSIVIHTKK